MTAWWRATGVLIALATVVLAAPRGPAFAADLDDLPPEVREKTQPVHLNWSKQLDRTLEGGLHLKGVELPGRPPATVGTGIEAVHLEGLEAPAQLPVEEVGASALSDAAQSLLVGLLAQGTTSAEDWRERIEANALTVADLCAVWRRFRREHSHDGERFGIGSSLWAAIKASIPAEGRKPANLGLEDAFSLGEIQLWGCDGEAAQQTFEALLACLPEGPTAGRVSRGLLAYRIAQCRKEALDLEGALDWFLKCAEWGTPEMTGGYDIRGEGLVEAARVSRRLGRDADAGTWYQKAIDECSGWGQTVAAFDLSTQLSRAGRWDDALAVLERVTEGSEWWSARVRGLHAMARICCDKGDVVAARECLVRAVAAARGGGGRSAESVGGLAEHAQRLLAALDEWDRSPIRVLPDRLCMAVEEGEDSPSAQFVVVTLGARDLSIVAPEWVTVAGVGENQRSDAVPGIRRTYRVIAREVAPLLTREDELVISTPGEPNGLVRIPVRLAAARFAVSPRSCFFGFVSPGDPGQQMIAVRCTSGRAFSVREAWADTPSIEVGKAQPVSEVEWQVPVRVIAARPSIINGRVTVRTDVAGEAAIEIPVYAHVVSRK